MILLARTGEGAKTKDGELILVEVQYLSETAYLKRLAYGAAKTIIEHLKLGEAYTKVKKVYSVSLLYFDVSRDGDDYIYHGKTEWLLLDFRLMFGGGDNLADSLPRRGYVT
uniref:PD-(D/E)XK nuclease family transposase n=1 Tax=Candidatus Kentrum sp. UNK TaxID=2126344 RepID=A0A451AG00_9GAMM|nr:MAG: PD-(D/E)XK nuclease family transposase [Candidatus Kentron sp. UNK]VFK71360.1 MAG: PD-(D/E)XK nuclease family transposase [Candidatus Kentron sp. UNK]